MTPSFCNNCLVGLFLFAFVTFSGCGLDRRWNFEQDVEVAPNKWLTLRRESGRAWFVSEWIGKKVTYKGKRSQLGEAELPVTLRDHEGTLYLIVFNREDLNSMKLIYLKLDASGKRFVPISHNEFPKSIATQNMWLAPENRMVGVDNEWIDTWDVIRRLDIESPFFPRSLTADIWIHLETGWELRKIETLDYEVKQKMVREYAAKYNPIPLPTLVEDE